jgi:hypothetical protein
MKKLLTAVARLSAALFFIIASAGCMKDKLTKTYTLFRPVYMNKADVLANIKSNNPQALKNTGKIYISGRYIFLNEINKGIHIIDNINPATPVQVGFINIPGNIDIAVKGNTLYADLYTDLLAIDMSDPLRAKLTKLVPDLFPERSYSNGFISDSSKVIVDWIQKDTTVDAEPKAGWIGCPSCSMLYSVDRMAGVPNPAASVPGIGGSMARFAVVNDYLYTINQSQLGVLNISNSANPEKVSTTSVGWNIETIYPFKEKLFIGSTNGLFIYDISNAAAPVNEGQFTHATACDPVVADDAYAYVTLRTGNPCTGINNELDVINVENLRYPSLVKTYAMSNPHGLSKDGNLLFVCDGKDGLKIYDAAEPGNLKLIKNINGIETYDVIAWNKKLLVVAKNGLYQFDYSNVSNIKLLSTLTISR